MRALERCQLLIDQHCVYRGMQSRIPQSAAEHFIIRQVHDTKPIINHVEKLVTSEEAAHLIRLTSAGMSRSLGDVKGSSQPIEGRTSESSPVPRGCDDIVKAIERRMCTLAGLPYEYMETMQVVRYKKGQKYNAHYDFFQLNNNSRRQRTLTIFVYLQSVSDSCGGGTIFHNVKNEQGEKTRFKPASGDALMWSNRQPNGEVEPMTLHSGEEVTCDEIKYGLNVWFGDKPFVASQ